MYVSYGNGCATSLNLYIEVMRVRCIVCVVWVSGICRYHNHIHLEDIERKPPNHKERIGTHYSECRCEITI